MKRKEEINQEANDRIKAEGKVVRIQPYRTYEP